MEQKAYWKKFSNKTIEYKFFYLAALGIITFIAIQGLFKLDISVDIEAFFLEDDPVLQNQNQFNELFEKNNFVGVLVESQDVFSRETLNLIKKTSGELEKHVPFAKEVISIVNFSDPLTQGPTLEFEDNIVISSDQDIEKYKNFYKDNVMLKGVFFSEDNKEAWILLPLTAYPPKNNQAGKENNLFTVGKAAHDVVGAIKQENAQLTATGLSVYAYRKKTEMLKDLAIILIIGAIVALVLSVIVFRSLQEVVGTMLVIALSVVFVLGIQGWLQFTIDSAFISVPILLTMGVGIGYAVHISSFFREKFDNTRDRIESITSAVSKCAKPIFFTAFTTTAALFSFVFIKIKPIQWVGYSAALCIVVVYLLSIVLFPIMVSFGKKHSTKLKTTQKTHNKLNPILNMFATWVRNHRIIIMSLFLITSVLGIYGTSKVQVDLNAEKMTGTRLPHMKDIIRIGNSQIAANEILDLVITMEEFSFYKLENIKRIETLEEKIGGLALVKKTNSLAKNIKNINYTSHVRMEEFNALPENEIELNNLLDFIDDKTPELMDTWNANNYSSTRISIELKEFSSKKIEEHIENIESFIAITFPKDTTFFFSGSTFQMATMNQYITKGLIRSLLSALITIALIMMFVFKSIRLGLVAMIPNVFPIIIAGGIMGFLNIPLEFVTMTVAPLILGLSVDDTIHLFWHFNEELKQNNDFFYSIKNTFSIVGKAITETTCILCATFLVFTFSKVSNIVNMGIIICVGLFTAYLSDIFVTPILIKKIKRLK